MNTLNKKIIFSLLAILWLPLQAKNIDEQFTEICDSHPNFSGMYMEKGRLIILVTDTDNISLQYDDALFKAFGITEALFNKAEFKKAKYSFLDLHKAYKVLLTNLNRITNVTMTDIDEKKNRIRIGVSKGTDLVKTRVVINELFAQASIEVPQDMLTLEIMEPSQIKGNMDNSIEVLPPLGLRGSPGVKAGGLQLSFPIGSLGLPGSCTWGFTARLQGELGFVTNSHCTSDSTAGETLLGPTEYRQSELTDAPIIATSFQDALPLDPVPDVTDDEGNPLVVLAADAHFARFEDSFAAPPVGFIARPEDNQGSLNIDTQNPYFRIVDKQAAFLLGTEVNKVGRTTGWSSGEIESTCINVITTVATSVFLPACQYRAGYLSLSGDSGSPVFVRVPGSEDEVILHGIHHSGTGVYSAIDRVEEALGGALDVVADPNVATPSLDTFAIPGVIQDEPLNILNRTRKSFTLTVQEPGRYKVLFQSSSEFDSRLFRVSLGRKHRLMAVDSGKTVTFFTPFLRKGRHRLQIRSLSPSFFLRHIQAVPVHSDFFLFPEEPNITPFDFGFGTEPFSMPGDFFLDGFGSQDLQPMEPLTLQLNFVELAQYQSNISFLAREETFILVCVDFNCRVQRFEANEFALTTFEQDFGFIPGGPKELKIISFSPGTTFFFGEFTQRP